MKINSKLKLQGTKAIALVSAVAVVVLLLLNYGLTFLGLRHSLFLDNTAEGLYTLSDKMKEECSFIDKLDSDEREVKITFCADPDSLVKSELTRVTYFMALQLADRFDNLTVRTVNVEYNPTAVSRYKPTSLSEITPTDVIISYGDESDERYRVVNAKNFWITSEGELYSYNGEYKMASIIMSVSSVNRPAAYFVTDHGETYYDPSPDAPADREDNLKLSYFYDLLTERGLEVKTLKISEVDEIPEDCVLLIINDPKTDFAFDPDRLDEFGYVSDTEKLDRYLVSDHGAIVVARDFKREGALPVFDSFLYEWGFDFSTAQVKDEENYMGGEHTTVIGQYDADENSYGYGIYGDFASLSSAPPMVFGDTGYVSCSFDAATSAPESGAASVSRNYAPLISTFATARSYEKNASTGEYVDLYTEGKLGLAAVSTRIELDQITGEEQFSYVFGTGSADFFSAELLGNSSYANYEVMSSLIENIARSDEFASIELGGTSYNSPSMGGKPLVNLSIYDKDTITDEGRYFSGLSSSEAMGISIVLMLLPLGVVIAGAAVCLRRRFL